MHLDVEQSVDLLLSSPPAQTAAAVSTARTSVLAAPTSVADEVAAEAAAAAGGSSRGSSTPANSQVRSRGDDGRLWVRFETAAAAAQMLQANDLVEQLAGAKSERCDGGHLLFLNCQR
jgi:hypothetical protein